MQFEEIGDLEERAYSQFFETMMSASQSGTGQGAQLGGDVISCPVAKGDNDDVSKNLGRYHLQSNIAHNCVQKTLGCGSSHSCWATA